VPFQPSFISDFDKRKKTGKNTAEKAMAKSAKGISPISISKNCQQRIPANGIS
jgi:hypothetical protein